ncbi:hypothetical protein NP233_g2280 [Leucocoprinus birnbaumii]|uniref:F-box domain-containing protein n=1 Tax=Leucocoprinus birnbaumii TaxID=56174 RepID=A0AAD5VYJ2_9AGAR|nr:hypothetical protein NP233_g2280 [Leucocoprinus birnbaumii]
MGESIARTSRSPSRLPKSVLIAIFEYIMLDWKPEQSPTHPLFTLSSICNSWRVALANRKLWTKVTFAPQAQYHADLFLRKSLPDLSNATIDPRGSLTLDSQLTAQLQALAQLHNCYRIRTLLCTTASALY